VCANEMSPADGRVVTLTYGCGAHSEAMVLLPPGTAPDSADVDVVDDVDVTLEGEAVDDVDSDVVAETDVVAEIEDAQPSA